MFCVVGVTSGACSGSASPVPIGSRIGPALAATLAAADQARAPWRCASADGPRLVDGELKLGEHTWKLAGDTVSLEGSGAIMIGVIADAGGSAPPTLAALGRLRTQLADADVVISLGGMGTTQPELEATLGTLADRAPWPLIAVPGDLESTTAQAAAIVALRARNQVVIDGRLARRIVVPGATIATVPGASAAVRLVAGADGCGYTPADVSTLFAELTTRPGLRIVASAEAPRVTLRGEPAGELALTPGALHEIDLSLHGPVTEAGSPARSGGRDGAAIALTPGTSDATTRLPGPRHAPSAGILTVNGNSWRWKPIVDAN